MASVVPQIAAPSLHLPFQVLLHLHAHLTPFAIIGQIGCFLLKFRLLYPTYRATLLALHFVSVLVQIVRPFLGFHGNLKGRIPSLSGFWILSALHLPSLLFLGLNSDIRPLPLEQFFFSIDCAFSSVELLIATVLIRRLANKQMEMISKMMAEETKKEGTNG
ncbi:hypothetical protein niasHS_010797 [Heterodera schachtii]|uniref:Uncharacterized protein n=1 Tax=Heterodera schachtii TaxID=97005 RepID=A0ABD2J084_HETSC